MNAKQMFQNTIAALLVSTTLTAGSASAWDFDKTRAADIVDRAVNDGNETAQLMLAMAIDDRVSTTYDHVEFRLPDNIPEDRLAFQSLNAEDIYTSIIFGSSQGPTKEALQTHNLQGAFALYGQDFRKAIMHYGAAEIMARRLINQDGLSPDLNALRQDAIAGKIAALRCADKVPKQDTTYKIEKTLAGLRSSDIAKDYRAFILRNVDRTPNTLTLDASGCWNNALPNATVVRPLAPFNYETNTAKSTHVLQ